LVAIPSLAIAEDPFRRHRRGKYYDRLAKERMKEAAIRVNKTRVGKESPAMENLPEPDTARDHAVRCLGIVEEKCNAKDAEKEALAYTPSPALLWSSNEGRILRA
jgi:hypothetical protein